MESVYITRLEYDEHSKRMEDEHRRMNHRIADLEKSTDENHKLLVAVETMAINIEMMQKEQNSQGKRITKLEEQDGKKWRRAKEKVLDIVLGVVVGFICAGIIWAAVQAF